MLKTAGTVVLLALIAACAVMEAPPGGPQDTTPPRVVSVFPSSDSAGVARDVRPVFTFSERIDGESFKNRLLVFPPMTFDRVAARGERLEIRFETLLPETTICLALLPGYKDVHREAPGKETRMVFFSTADSIARGEIRGIVFFKNRPDSSGAAELFFVRPDSLTDLATVRRARVAFCDPAGRYAFPALPTNDARFLLRGFIDSDRDGYFSDGKEYGMVYPDTIVLGAGSGRVEGIDVMVIDPKEPGSVEGSVVNESRLDSVATVRLDPLAGGERALWARTDSTGSFLFGSVPPGDYLFSAFIDVHPDTLCGVYRDAADTTRTFEEPCVKLPDTLRVKPGERRKLDPVTLK